MAEVATKCAHLDQIKEGVKPLSDTCLECQKEGTHPVELRLCLTCGHVGCCDNSIGRHAHKHSDATGHAIIQSFKSAPPGASEWRYCYVDKEYVD